MVQLDPDDDPGDARAQAFYDVRVAAAAVDRPDEPPPGWRSHLAGLRVDFGGLEPQTWLAGEGPAAAVLGGYQLSLPRSDNVHGGLIDVTVRPDARRRGVGRVLVEHACSRLRAGGRRLLIGETAAHSPGPAFAAALGAERGLVDVRRVLDVRSIDAGEHGRLLADARERARGYSLVRWAGPVPEEHLADVAVLLTRMSDAPLDDLDWEEEVWTPERVRRAERYNELSGDRSYCLAARQDATGRLVAQTTVFVRAQHPWWSVQGDTIVLPEHRGHRLGLLVKLSMLPWLREREPEIHRLVTWNAGSNSHMIAINELLGYQVLDRWEEWQLRV